MGSSDGSYFNSPISGEHTSIKTKHTQRGGFFLLVNIFNCLVLNWTVKDK